MNTFKVKIQAKREDSEYIRLTDLVHELSKINSALNQVDQCITKSNVPTLFYRIISMEQRSPALVELEAVPKDPQIDRSDDITSAFFDGLGGISKGEMPDCFDYETLYSFGEIGKKLRSSLQSITFCYKNKEIILKKDLEESVKKIIGEDEIDKGSISGILESLNIHGGKNKFTVYPIAGPTKIDCHFPQRLVDEAIKAVNRYIELTGDVKYRRYANYPHEIIVEEMEIFPDENELPTIYDLQGMAPNATHGVSSEVFIANIRSEE